MPKLPQHIEERVDDYGSLWSFPPNAIHAKAEIPQRDAQALIYNGHCITHYIKSFIATIVEEERKRFIQEVEDVRSQYEHEVHGLNSVDSFNHALDHIVRAINLIKEDEPTTNNRTI